MRSTHLFVLCASFAFATAFKAVASPPPEPVWPTQFDCGFGMSAPATDTINATSHFYYNWNLQATLIDYPEYCIPILYEGSQKYPCQLYFNPTGTFFSQPDAGYECCLLFAGVGSVPPQFLAGFNYSGLTQLAYDWYGVAWNTNLWVADGGFQYWTSVGEGFDIQFQDAGALLWNFGPFNVTSQPSSLFQLPSTSCSSVCDFMTSSKFSAGFGDPYVSLAHVHKKYQDNY